MKFGTDGVRGVANSELTAEFALRLGRAAARVLSTGQTPTVVIGGDTRISTPMLEAALAAGFAAEGVDVRRLGVVPTPAVAFAAQRTGAMGAMVSASHNPYRDNGIKLFATGGIKLADDVEAAIERELDAMQPPVGQPGRIAVSGDAVRDGVIAEYVDHVVSIAGGRTASSLRVVVDAANGAASSLARVVFERLGVDVVVIGDEPDGTNINEACGATFPSTVAEAVVARGADVGIALDGDADRLIAVDHTGRVVDGDHIIAIAAIDLAARGLLANDTVVVTTMTNLGFHHAMRAAGIGVVTTDVGDRYVLEALAAGGHVLGGEQSGHVIFADHATTGDGMLTAVALLDIIARSGRSLADLAASAMTSLPQILVNVEVSERVPDVAELLADDVARLETALAGSGRVLLRPSGTEPLVRVMVEAATAGEADRVAHDLATVVRARFA
jgi:phosphoglucosamine mutase